MSKTFEIMWNSRSGNYYIMHSNDLNKWGLPRERAILKANFGYYWKKGSQVILLTDEEIKCLNKFRREIKAS